MNTCSPKAYTISGCDSMQADLAPQYHLTPLILAPVAQFISICRWFQLTYKDRLAPLENVPFSPL
jgi:hypothetical protein